MDIWHGIREVCSIVDHNKRPQAHGSDSFGNLHVLLFGDYKSSDKRKCHGGLFNGFVGAPFSVTVAVRCLVRLSLSRQLPPATSPSLSSPSNDVLRGRVGGYLY